jgi:hypothetical protein
MWWLSLSVVHYVWSITVQPAVICHHEVVPETSIVVFHWLNILIKAFTLSLTSPRLSAKKSKRECKKWTSDMQLQLSLYIFRSFWIPSLKSGELCLLNKYVQTHVKLSQPARSVLVRVCTKAVSSRVSQSWGPMKMPSFSFAVLMLGNVLLTLESLWICLSHSSH